jgi:hypothetical protein
MGGRFFGTGRRREAGRRAGSVPEKRAGDRRSVRFATPADFPAFWGNCRAWWFIALVFPVLHRMTEAEHGMVEMNSQIAAQGKQGHARFHEDMREEGMRFALAVGAVLIVVTALMGSLSVLYSGGF